jgi:hypothetical protein
VQPKPWYRRFGGPRITLGTWLVDASPIIVAVLCTACAASWVLQWP